MKNIFKLLLLPLLSLSNFGCSLGYLLNSADGQYKLMSKKMSLEKALGSPQIDEESKRKIRLVQEVKAFGQNELKLSQTKNYDSFVLLDDKYVTYAVTASPKNKIDAYLWHFPIVGDVPYKGYFKKKDAEEEALELKKKNLDVMVRGVSAYSTLGWFSDPLLSSMTRYEDYDLVETIIHESTHATVFIADNAEFNERLATYVGEKGAKLYYNFKEGANSPTLKKMENANEDSKVFFNFVRSEIKKMSDYYEKNKANPLLEKERESLFSQIKENYTKLCAPKLKTKNFDYFKDMTINNAVLLNYKIYYDDFEIFEKLFEHSGHQWDIFFNNLMLIKKSKSPESDLKKILLK